ncbi:hypothetical protein SBFV2_gp67 [Sulfolobales Beppu filamentous virus 2]|uniref:Uncharacterized protein n=1 Tax=Sulfolobales Beppu filamentous virus 2 TaxID=2493123 RepID=A0A3S8NF06_9VIRU|nr:hypothetical protein HOU84_gp67 [Sulfolobales Beppu filamentous virus 2]AZI75834.1 hypothetical protein SBFV2_gp67 [Sulfolobales Beppu filamentous virus 2]
MGDMELTLLKCIEKLNQIVEKIEENLECVTMISFANSVLLICDDYKVTKHGEKIEVERKGKKMTLENNKLCFNNTECINTDIGEDKIKLRILLLPEELIITYMGEDLRYL